MLNRRQILAGTGALLTLPAMPRIAQAGGVAELQATTRVLDIGGRAATVMGLLAPDGSQGLRLDPGQRFRLRLTNALDQPTLIHWHGQIPPNAQDGVPGMPAPPLQPGEARDYDFAAEPGTHWMHSHLPLQEMSLLAAPLIVQEAPSDRQDVVMLLHDFSFTPAEELLAGLSTAMAGMDHGTGDDAHAGHDMAAMADGSMDLNDIAFDAYLANDRTLDDPQIVPVERGGRLRLRVINAAAATAFHIDIGSLAGRVVAVDGRPVQPLPAQRFGLGMAQRVDIEIDLPAGPGAWPVLALREGAVERTGLILATPGGQVDRLASVGDAPAPAFDRDLAQERRLRAVTSLAVRSPDRRHSLMLEGTMSPYRWTINGATWGDHLPVQAIRGERVEILFHNMSGMAHPMHLHGHVFQVVAVNGQAFAGALRDTVWVPPMQAVTVALDAGEAARWMLHCHHMPHLATGMMTEFAVSAA